MWKICTKCKKHKPLWAFVANKNRKLGTGSWCKKCHSYNMNHVYDYSDKKHQWYINNKELTQNRCRKHYLKNREKILKERKTKKASYSKYNTLLTVDESPRKKIDDILEVRCKLCRKYFTPTDLEVYHRVEALNSENGSECNLYCSEECKQGCPVFNSQGTIPKPSLRETIPPELRKEVLSRNNGMCEMCSENPSEEAHHEKPVSTHPHLQLDKENLWGLCKECHYNVVHQLEGCKLSELRKKSSDACIGTRI